MDHSDAGPVLSFPSETEAAHELLRLHEQLSPTAPRPRLVCAADGRVLALNTQAKAVPEASSYFGQAVQTHAARLLTDAPASGQVEGPDTVWAYTSRPITFAGQPLWLIEWERLASQETPPVPQHRLDGADEPYRALLNAAADGILLTDGYRVLDSNLPAARLLGYRPELLATLDDITQLVATSETNESALTASSFVWRRLLADTRQTGKLHHFESRLRRPDGAVLTVEVRLSRVYIAETPCVQVLIRDTAEQLTDEALLRIEVQRQTTRELRNLLGDLRLSFVSFDLEANILAVNDYFVELSGYAREELLGRNYFEVFVPDPAECARRIAYYFNEVLRDEQIEPDYESVIFTRNGQRLIMRWNRLFERDAANRIVATLSIGRDVTAGILAQEDSQRNRARFQDLFDNAYDLIQHISPDNHFLSVNRAWRETLGYTDEDMWTLTLPDIVHPYYRAKLMHQLRALYRGEAVGRLETVLLTRSGRSVHLIGSISCQWQDGQVVASRLILHDITERIQAERLQKVYYSIANLAISVREPDALYAAIHRELSRLLDTHNFFIALCDEPRTQLAFAYYADQHAGQRPWRQSRPFGRGVSEYIIGRGQPQLLTQTDLQRLIADEQLDLFGLLPEVLLGAPLAVGGRIIGVMVVQDYSRSDAFTAADLDVLHFISSQVALAIDRKHNELQLHRQNARLNAIFESGSHLMWSVSPTHQLTAYNSNFATAFLEQPDGQLLPAGVSSARNGAAELRLVPRQNAELWEQEYARAFGGETRQFEVCTRRPDGTEAWAEIYLNPIRLPDGTLEEVSGIAHDITENKLAQLELARQEELFRGIFESFQDVYYRTDAEGRLILLSPSVRANFGYEPADLMGRSAADCFADPKTFVTLVAQVRHEGVARGFEAILLDHRGEHRAVLINARRLTDMAGEPVGLEGLVMDISQLKHTQDELLIAKQEAEAALHAKTQFLANMSHELRTPMNGIIGMIELLHHTVTTPEQTEYVETLRRSSDALLAILNDILDLSKIQAGKLTVRLAPTDLPDVVEKVRALFANRAAQKQLGFTCDISPAVPQFVETDDTRLLQILSNLTSNAIKFTSQGAVGLRLALNPLPPDAEGRVEVLFEVIDSGIGIAPEDAKRLFTDFTQLDTTSTKTYGGTGLGLSISRQLTGLLGGTIGVKPNPTGGSIFWFTIRCRPLQAEIAQPATRQKSQNQVNTLTGLFPNRPHVLLVDDNQVNQVVAARLLERLGCQVDVAENGFAALHRLENADTPAYTLIFMDIQMPELDGTETTRRLRQLLTQAGKSCPPVVAMTAYSMQGDDVRFREQGFDDYVAKPVTSQELFTVMHRQCPLEPALLPTEGNSVAALPPIPSPPAVLIVPDPAVLQQLEEVGGPEFVRELFDEFVNESAPLLQQAAETLATGDFAVVRDVVHQIKGSSAQLGINALAEPARALEHDLRTGAISSETLVADFARLHALFTTFAASYTEHLPH